eukprot:TRINITY_DN8915_c0_g4_i1.p4 TRINITY_DN8915_c0_g4~~TRINITY_DN8915_c0_g4_i1.p4  ORF type:complete len:157 (+),score=49.74 TRINITY_DN8915_c0_g4_i1:320-790(+)
MYCWINKCGGCGDKCDANCFAGGHGKVLCQHGLPECGGNLIELCAISLYNQTDKYYPFIVCLEQHQGDGCESCAKDAPTCAKEAGMDWGDISACVSDQATADKLTMQAGKKTADYGSGRVGTPWVVVSGQVVNEANLLQIVCDAYNGTKPAGCPKK